MLCKNPFMKGVLPFGCGQCLPCRFNRRRLWTHRLVLESYKHSQSAFVTLTYGPEVMLPGGSLDPSHVQKWLKRIRKAVAPAALRFFLVGEYGDETQRPHYHVALFGYPPCARSRTNHRLHKSGKCCSSCNVIQDTWKLGSIDLGHLTPESAQYIAGYVTKKMTKADDPRLNGRHPEFARMSLRPGIGGLAVDDLCDVLTTEYGCESIIETGDVPRSLAHGKRNLPLGRYLRSKVRERLGFKDGKTPLPVLAEYEMQMRELLKAALADTPIKTKENFKQWLILENKQKVLNMETKSKLFAQRKKV